MSNKLLKRMAVALLSASMLLSSTGITSLAVNQSDVATTASSDTTSVSVSDDTAKVTASGGSLVKDAPKMLASGGTVSTQDAGYDDWPSGNGTQSNPYTIESLEDFLGMQTIINDSTRTDKYFKLMVDLNLSGVTTFSDAVSDYSGIAGVLISISKSRIASAGSAASNIFFNLDGNNHILYGLNVSNSNSMTAAIFGYINSGSTISNLIVRTNTVNTTYANSLNSAILAIQNEGTITDCTFTNCIVKIGAPSATTDSQLILNSAVYRGTAVVAGDNAGTIENCSVVNCRVEFEGNARYVGIVSGQNRGTIRNVSLSGIRVIKKEEAATEAGRYIGGIAGSNTGSSSLITGCSVDLAGADAENPVVNNLAYGDIVGGAVGRNAGSVVDTVVKSIFGIDDTITRSNNSMYSSHVFGGVVGENLASGTVTSSSAIGMGIFIENDDVTRNVFGYGGIIGRNSGTLSGCVATGIVVDPGTASTYMTAGGLVGQATSTTVGTLSNSFAFVALPQSHADIGALIGRGGSPALITNCHFDATVAGRSFPCESYADAFSGDISSGTKAIVLNGNTATVSKADLTPALASVNSYILPAFNFTAATPAAYLESGTTGISLSNATASVTLSSSTTGSAGNLLVTSTVTMAANIGSSSGITFDYRFKVPVLYPSAHTDSGHIVISNSTEFNFIKYAPFSKFKLAANVTASPSWTPIKFFGVIHGAGNTLTVTQPLFTRVYGSRCESLTGDNEAAWIAGSRDYGYVHDLKVVLNSNLTNTAVFGSCADVTFTDVTFNRAASAEIVATRNTVGAFINEIRGGAYIYNCYTNVPIRISGSNLNYFGGMAARINANDLIMDNCGSSSAILAQANYAPDILASLIGFLEKNSAYGRVSNCYATGKVEPAQDRCYIAIGQYGTNGGILQNNIWSISDTQQGARESISSQSHQTENFAMWRFSDDYGQVNQGADSNFAILIPDIDVFDSAALADFTITVDTSKVTMGTAALSSGSVNIPLRALVEKPDSQVKITHSETGLVARLNIISGLTIVNNVVKINTAADLIFYSSKYALSKNSGETDYTNKSVEIMADIDMNGYTLESIMAINPSTSLVVPFSGNFFSADGEKFTISNLNIVPNHLRPSAATGLFSYVTGTEDSPVTFENLIFENINVGGGDYTGTFAGNAIGSIKFSNVSLNSSTVTANSNNDFVGGLVGAADDASTTAEFYGVSISDLTITANDFVGGYVGFLNGTNTDDLTTLPASIVVQKIDPDPTDPDDDILNELTDISISADGFAGALFGAVSAIDNGQDSSYTDVVVNASAMDYNYNNISMQVSDVDLSDSDITTVEWAVGGLIGASNAAGYPDDYSGDPFDGYDMADAGVKTWVKDCEITNTDIAVTTENMPILDYYCSAGLVAGYYGGLVENVTVSDCSASGAVVGGFVGSKNVAFRGDGCSSLGGIAVNNCDVLGTTTLSISRDLPALDPAVGGILGKLFDYGFMMPCVWVANCGIGKDVTIYSNNIAGGICGDLRSDSTYGLTSLEIVNCTSFATITNNYGDNTADSLNYFGGIAGVVSVMDNCTFSVRNCAVAGSIYSSSDASTKLIGGLAGYDVGNISGDLDEPMFSDCYVAVQLNNNSASENDAYVADGFVMGNSENDFVTYIDSLLRNIKISSFDQSTKYVLGYAGLYGSASATAVDLLSDSLCEDINKQCTYSPSTFFSDNTYKLDNTTLSADVEYVFDFTDSTHHSYDGMSIGAGTDSLVFDNSDDLTTGKKKGWITSNDYVGIVSSTESTSGSQYTYDLNIRAHRVGVSKIYGEFVSSSILVPGTTDEYFTFNVGIRVTSKYTDVTLQGSGTQASPYLISNEAELGVLSCSHNVYTLDKYYLVTADIELTGELFPIGSMDNPFTGSFNGGGHTIYAADGGSSITVGDTVIVGETGSTSLGLGLFGFTNGATISNIDLEDFRVEPASHVSDAVAYAGAVTAYAINTTFTAVSVSDANVSGAYICGGIVGHAEFSGSGFTSSDSTIKTASVVNTSVSATGSTNTTGVAGGIAGEFSGIIGNETLASGQTEDILAEGCHITSNWSFVGGIVGRNIYNATPGNINITINNAKVRKAASDPANVYEIKGSNERLRAAAGGIIGALFSNTSHNGSVNDTCVINNSVVEKGVDVYANYVAGGIIGYSYLKKGSVTINACESYANVTTLNSDSGEDRGSAAIVGYLVEFTIFHIKNSVAGGKLTYNTAGGGIFGSFKTSATSSAVSTVTAPIVYNCVVSAEFVDRQSGSTAGLVLGEYYNKSNSTAYNNRMNALFPSTGYTVVPFMNIFISSYQYDFEGGYGFSRSGDLNQAGYIDSIVKFIDLNCLRYSVNGEDYTVPYLYDADVSVTEHFLFDPTSELNDYIDNFSSVASFRTVSELNSVSDYLDFNLESVRSESNSIVYNPSFMTVRVIRDVSENMEYIYDNGVVIGIQFVAIPDVQKDNQGNYKITRVAHLMLLSIDPNGRFKQYNNLDFGSATRYNAQGTYDAFDSTLDETGNPIGEFYNGGSYWKPVNFSGTYDGGGCTITGLIIDRNNENAGLFGTLTGTVKNLTLSGVDITGGEYTGAVAAVVGQGGHIENVTVNDGTAQSTIVGSKYVGGIAGRANSEAVAESPELRVPAIENSSVVGCSIVNDISAIYNNGNEDLPGGVTAGIVAYSAGAYIKNCTVNSGTIIGVSEETEAYKCSCTASGIAGVAAEPSRATDTDTEITGCSVYNGVVITGTYIATGILGGTSGDQEYDEGDYSLNITDCTVGGGAYGTRITSLEDCAGGIFSQPVMTNSMFYDTVLKGAEITIQGCKVENNVYVLAGMSEEDGYAEQIGSGSSGYAGGIVGYLGLVDDDNVAFVSILACESYANVYAIYDAASILASFDGKFFRYEDEDGDDEEDNDFANRYFGIEASIAGGYVYSSSSFACGFIGQTALGYWDYSGSEERYNGNGIIRDCIFSAELVSESGNDYIGMISNIMDCTQLENTYNAVIAAKYDDLFKNIYYSSYNTNYNGSSNTNFNEDLDPVHAFAPGYSSGTMTYITLIDISSDVVIVDPVTETEETYPVVMADNANSGSFSPLVFTKYEEGVITSHKIPLQVNLHHVSDITYELDEYDDYVLNDETGEPVVTVVYSDQATDVGVKANSFNLSTTPGLTMPIKLTGAQIDENGASLFTVSFNNIADDTRHSAQVTPRDADIATLFVEITGGLKIPISMVSADLEGEGTRDNPFLVQNIRDLGTASRASGGFFWKQTVNLDFSAYVDDPDDPDDDFMPIGSERTPFNGGYDGNGFRIYNLSFNLPNRNYVGLFGYVNGNAELKNIHVELTDDGIKGAQYVGGLVGAYNGRNAIVNCSVVNGKVEGTAKVGGLAGDMATGATQCFTSTQVKAIRTNEPVYGCGGLVGRVVYVTDANTFTLDRCFTSGSVVANQTCGALIGSSSGSYATLNITNCFSTADVFFVGSSSVPESYMTSLVGYDVITNINHNSINLSNSYFAGTNSKNTSGLRVLPDGGSYTNVYYDNTVSGSPESAVTGLSVLSRGAEVTVDGNTTVSLPTGFSSTYWSGVKDGYPVLAMADAYSNIYSRIGSMALTANAAETSPNTGFRYSVTIPSTINSANVSVLSSVKGSSDENEPYPGNYDTGLTGNTSAKTSDFLWKTDSGKIVLLRNIFGTSAFTGTYETSYAGNKALPYVTASYTQSCAFEGLTATEGIVPDSTPVSITASRKIVIPLENAPSHYYIATERQLRAITDVTTCTKLSGFSSIGTLNSDRVYIGYDIALNKSLNFKPIPQFLGIFDGGGYTISGLKIDLSSPATDNVGFFAQVKGTITGENSVVAAEIKNLTLSTAGVSGGNNVGVLAGQITDTVSISDCYVYAENDSNDVPGTVSGVIRVGGLVGSVVKFGEAGNLDNENHKIRKILRCGSYIEVSGNSRVGGLVGMSVLPIEECGSSGIVTAAVTTAASALPTGYSGDIGVGIGGLVGTTTDDITKSYASGNVSVTALNNTTKVIGIGGLAGIVDSGATVETVFSSGEVSVRSQSGSISSNNSGSKFGVGGLIGVSGSPVSACYSGSIVRADITATISAIDKGIGGLIGIASGLQDAYSSGSVSVNSELTNVKCGRIIGKTSSTANINLYYDIFRKSSDNSVEKNIGEGDADNKVTGIKTSDFFKARSDGGYFDTTSVWGVNDGAYPVLKAFFGPDVSERIMNAVALSVVTITYDERDTSAFETGVVTMAFKMPTELTITNGTYSRTFEFEVEPAEGEGYADVIEVAPNTYVPVRTSNTAQDVRFTIFVKNHEEDGTRSVSLSCPQMLGTEAYPYLIATAEDLKHVAMSQAQFNAVDSGSHYKYWITPITIENGEIVPASGKVYYKFMSNVNMKDDEGYITYHIEDLVSNAGTPESYNLFGNTVTFAGFEIDGDDFSVNNLNLTTSFIDEVNANSTIKDLMFDNLNISAASSNNIALIGKNSGTLDGIIVNTRGVTEVTEAGQTTPTEVASGISGNRYVAGLAAENAGTITNSVADVKLIGSAYGGGLVGSNSGTIERCAANVNITANGDTFGGFAAENTGTIIDSFSMGSINATNTASSGDPTNRSQIGGFVGYNTTNDNTKKISSAYSTVNLSGYLASTSGLFAGQNANAGTIESAYSSGTVKYSGTALTGNNLFCGSNASTATLTDCYYDMFMAGSDAAASDLENSAATDALFLLACFSDAAKGSAANAHGFILNEVRVENTVSHGYPQLNGLINAINAAKDEETGALNSLKFRMLQGYSHASTAAIKTAYGQFIDTLPVSSDAGVSVNTLTLGLDWNGSSNSLSFRTVSATNPVKKDVRAAAALNNASITASTTVVINELQNSTVTVSRVFTVSAGGQNPMFANGNGSAGSPYQIPDAATFNKLKTYGPVTDANYIITNNINGASVEQVSLFQGNLNGDQFVIYDTADCLFKDIVGGTVANLGIVGANINASATDDNNNFGMIAGTLSNGGHLRNSYAIGSLTVGGTTNTYVNVGGLVGNVSTNAIIEDCASSGKVINNCSHEADSEGFIHDTAGGIAGIVDGAALGDCMSTAFVSGSGEVGGIAGYLTNGSGITTALFAGSAADSGMRDSNTVAAGARVGNIAGAASNGTTVTGAIIDSQTVMVNSANAYAKTTKELLNTEITGWSTPDGTSYPTPMTASDSTSMFARGLSAATLPIFFEYKQADGSVYGYDTVKVPTTTSTANAVSVATPVGMDAGTAVTGYHVFNNGDPGDNTKTAVVPVITIANVTNTVSRYIEPKLVRILSLSYDVATSSSASAVDNNTMGVQIKNRYGALNMSSEAFTKAAAAAGENPAFEDIVVPIAQGGFYVGAKLPKGYEYQVKWKDAASEAALQNAAVVENEYGYFVDTSDLPLENDEVYFEITIVPASRTWGVFNLWDSLVS